MLFNRSIGVSVGRKEGQKDAVFIDDLKVSFEVTMDRNINANKCRIDITNLSEDTRNKFDETEDVVILEAGYKDQRETLFVGDINDIEFIPSEVEHITRILSGDGERALRDTYTSLSYKAGTGAKAVLNELTRRLGLSNNLRDRISRVTDRYFSAGYAHTGKVGKEIQTIANSIGLSVSVKNGVLSFEEDADIDKNLAVLVGADSGLIQSPEKITKKENNVERSGWRIRTLLNPQIVPDGVVSVESKVTPADTFYKVDKVTHRGDTFGDEWSSVAEIFRIGAN